MSAFRRLARTMCALAVAAASSAAPAAAQVSDGTTPPGHTPGTPTGSYELDDFDTVNLFTGALNFSLPLRTVEGRGDAGYTMVLPVEQHWGVEWNDDPVPLAFPRFNWWRGYRPGYGPGTLIAYRSVSVGPGNPVATRLTFTGPTGTQNEFRDDATEGRFELASAGTNRGRTFRSHDGSQMTFVSDVDIFDVGAVGPDGLLMLANGTRYRIDGGLVSWIQDRNGNVVTLTYGPAIPGLGPQVTRVVDALNRAITIAYFDDGSTRYDTITYQGWGGLARTIRVDYARLHDALVDDEVILTLGELFAATNWANRNEPHDPWVVASVALPNGHQYTLRYNPYGELAETELPTGGRHRYAYGPGAPEAQDAGGTVTGGICRRLRERSVYEADSGEPTRRMTLSAEELAEVAVGDVRVTVDHLDPSAPGVPLERERHYFHGRASAALEAPDYESWRVGIEYQTKTLDGAGAVLRTRNIVWQQRASVSWIPGGDPNVGPANEPRITSEATVLETGQQILVLQDYYEVARLSLQFDNLKNSWELGFDGVPVRRRHFEYVGNALYLQDAVHLRRLVAREEVYEINGGSEVLRSRTSYDYDEHPSGLLGRSNASGRRSPETHPVGFTVRGNVTGTRRWLDTTGTDLLSRKRYDMLGNAVEETDARGATTAYDFADDFGTPDGNATSHQPPPELGGQASFAFVSLIARPLSHTTRMQTDYYIGQTVDESDPNGVVTSSWFNDPLDRFTRVIEANGTVNPDGTRDALRTGVAYDDDARTVTTVKDKDVLNDQRYKRLTAYDSLGREVEARTWEGTAAGGSGWIVTARSYDARGLLAATSNPYRSDEAPVWTVTSYDALRRPIQVRYPDNAVVTTVYDGNATTVTDPALKARKRLTDAQGRTIEVVEDPSSAGGSHLDYHTTYGYDGLDHLILASQGGQTRRFVYDSLSRLTSQTTPEAGTVVLSYDANGNLVKRTDARGVISCWGILSGSACDGTGYDALDRATRRSHSDGTSAVTYAYGTPGGLLYGMGRLVSVSNSASTTSVTSYDALGRVRASVQATGGQNYTTYYGYDRAGHLTSEAYPTGRVLFSPTDEAGRPARVVESGRVYADSFDYHAHGAVRGLRLGNNRWESSVYNNRLQARFLRVGTAPGQGDVLEVQTGYGGTVNNGNVTTEIVTVPGASLVQSYTYDELNRLKTAGESPASWSQVFTYDRYGNRAATGALDPTLTPGSLSDFDAATNRLNTLFSASILYDLAGNLTRDGQGHAMAYDADNRQSSFGNGPTAATYEYDGDGRRVKRTLGGLTTVFVYDVFGKLTAEYGPAPLPQTVYLSQDHLGSARLATDGAGAVLARWDYLPFGEQIPVTLGGRGALPGYGSEPGVRQKFTGKERDLESGLDFFRARYFSGPQGRFLSPDPITEIGERAADPQNWSRYGYARNNPLKFVDPDGKQVATATGTLIGGSVGFAFGLAEGKSGRELWGATVRGAVTGALLGLVADTGGIAGPGVAGWAMAGGLAETAGGAAEAVVTGHDYTLTALQVDFAAGFAMGPVNELGAAGSRLGRVQVRPRGVFVLGHFEDDYVRVAEAKGARFFFIPEPHASKMPFEAVLAADFRSVRRAMARGDTFELTRRIGRIRPGSVFEKEIKFILSDDFFLYRKNWNGRKLIPMQ